MRVLDLFCGAGGASSGYRAAGLSVVGVDIAAGMSYPYEFHRADAIHWLEKLARGARSSYHLIHASPPCQAWCAYRRRGAGVGNGYPKLIAKVRDLLRATGVPYVIENVEGARSELVEPVTLCGSMFGLGVRRHRLFEVGGFEIDQPDCDHASQQGDYPQATNRKNRRRTCEVGVWRIPLPVQHAAMGGCEWMSRAELSQAIPPAYAEYIGRQFIASRV